MHTIFLIGTFLSDGHLKDKNKVMELLDHDILVNFLFSPLKHSGYFMYHQV